MYYKIDGNIYEVVINRKRIKNLYIRVKEDMKIYVSCNNLTSKSSIEKLLDENYLALKKMIERQIRHNIKNNSFYYLGNPYEIIYEEKVKSTYIEDNKIYSRDEKMLSKWLKDETLKVFDDRYVYVFNHFNENIKSPILKVRNMKTRWGVYNRVNHTITLNSRLIEFSVDKIDYVIVHELSHIIHFNHSKKFWNLVEKYIPNYKRIRKELNH